MKRENFGSQFGTIMAMTGSAVGLGNLWRYPYMVGVYGGAAFVLVYIIVVFLLCLPILNSEMIAGRRSQTNAFRAFNVLAPGSKWKWAGVLMVFTPLVVLSYYSVIGGWSLEYLYKALCFDFTASAHTRAELDSIFSNFISSAWTPLIGHTIFLGVTAMIVVLGVKKGIENFGKVMMPLLFLLVILIAVRSATLPGAGEGFAYLFKFYCTETALSYTTVSSPISGYISERSVDIGTLVSPNGKSLLATVVKSDTVRVDFSMTGLDYLKSKARNVNLGQKDTTRKWNPYITITLPDNTPYPLRGLVDFADPQVDPETGTFSVRAEMANPDRILLPGQFTKVRLLLDVREHATVIPTKAVIIEKGGAYIFVIRPDSVAERRMIELGPEVGNRVIIERGAVPGEKIVVEGFHKLTHGDKVEPVTAPVPQPAAATESENPEK